MKKVRSNQASLLINSFTELSKTIDRETQVFPLSIVKTKANSNFSVKLAEMGKRSFWVHLMNHNLEHLYSLICDNGIYRNWFILQAYEKCQKQPSFYFNIIILLDWVIQFSPVSIVSIFYVKRELKYFTIELLEFTIYETTNILVPDS